MTRNILYFPVRKDFRLRCIWVETGNPVQPLACKWVSGETNTEESADPGDGARLRRWCA